MFDPHLSLWPRLLAAAPPDLAAKLRELQQRNASLTLKDDGGFSLRPGTRMTQAEYDAIKETFDPDAMRQALHQARKIEHPWMGALRTAYADLRQRCDDGTDALQAATKAKEEANVKRYTIGLLKRHLQAVMVLESLHGAGEDRADEIKAHMDEVISLSTAIEQAGGKAPVTNVSWPVALPEGGRLWLIDGPDAKCDGWVTDEPRLITTVLSEALRPLQAAERKAG